MMTRRLLISGGGKYFFLSTRHTRARLFFTRRFFCSHVHPPHYSLSSSREEKRVYRIEEHRMICTVILAGTQSLLLSCLQHVWERRLCIHELVSLLACSTVLIQTLDHSNCLQESHAFQVINKSQCRPQERNLNVWTISIRVVKCEETRCL